MAIFTRLKRLRQFQRTRLPHLRSIEDFDIVLEVGAAQEYGRPATPKQLAVSGIAPPATIYRRLGRLSALGVIARRFSQRDGRIVELALPADIAGAYRDMAKLLGNRRVRGRLHEAPNSAGPDGRMTHRGASARDNAPAGCPRPSRVRLSSF